MDGRQAANAASAPGPAAAAATLDADTVSAAIAAQAAALAELTRAVQQLQNGAAQHALNRALRCTFMCVLYLLTLCSVY